jgi:hypothetical protein
VQRALQDHGDSRGLAITANDSSTHAIAIARDNVARAGGVCTDADARLVLELIATATE